MKTTHYIHVNASRGFTLIELLVVIAIIGILSSVVLASLNTARGKGANAAIKSNLANMRAMAEIYYDANGGSYGTQAFTTACPTAGAANNMFATTTTINATSAARNAGALVVTCYATASIWAASASLKVNEGSNGAWCVDSNGTSKSITGVLASGTVCP